MTTPTPPSAHYVAACTCQQPFGGAKPLCPIHDPQPEVTVTTTPPALSNCCKAPVMPTFGSEGTNFCVCEKCGKACDVAPVVPSPRLRPQAREEIRKLIPHWQRADDIMQESPGPAHACKQLLASEQGAEEEIERLRKENEALRSATESLMFDVRWIRDNKPEAYDAMVTPDFCNSWDVMKKALSPSTS